MAKASTKKQMSETTLIVAICSVIIIAFAALAFWYVKVYSQDPLVIMSKQAPALNMTPPLEQGKSIRVASDVTEYSQSSSGSVVSFHDYNFKLSGSLSSITGNENADTMRVSYTLDNDGMEHQTSFTKADLTQYKEEIDKYISEGDTSLFTNAFGESTGEKYYTKFATQYLPVLVNTTLNKTYVVVPKVDDDSCLLIQSDDAINVTSGMSTKLYRKLEDTVYSQRVFSDYETAAINNTRNQALGIDASTVPSEEPTEDFEDEESTDSTAKYTHEQLVEIDDHLSRERLKDDGSIAGTTIQLSTTSEAEADVTTGTIPVLTVDGLKIDNVSFQYDAARTGNVLTFKGLTQTVQNSIDVQNTNEDDSEFILIMKFISTDNRILDFVKITNIGNPLPSGDKTTFTLSLTDVKYSGTLQKIQFEVWR